CPMRHSESCPGNRISSKRFQANDGQIINYIFHWICWRSVWMTLREYGDSKNDSGVKERSNMLTNHGKLLHFFIEANEVTGRKKLQKMIYILQVCGIPFGEKFHYHFYGPYSEELSLRVEELCNLGFLKEDR